MGGFGSGNWYSRPQAKSTVEQSLVLAVRDFRDHLQPGHAGTFTWKWNDGRESSISYFVTECGPLPWIRLSYRWNDCEEVRISVSLQTTRTQFGGKRLWLTCPLSTNGRPCRRRIGKLYLPPRARYFGCRVCHDLTYRSSQEAHQAERHFASMERMANWLQALRVKEEIE